jgi:serine phosphatase RsbU (regulator of sigma subunit)
VLDVIREHRRGSASEIIGRVHRSVEEFTGHRPLDDDIAVVICKLDG